jgi:hypothetical protein
MEPTTIKYNKNMVTAMANIMIAAKTLTPKEALEVLNCASLALIRSHFAIEQKEKKT